MTPSAIPVVDFSPFLKPPGSSSADRSAQHAAAAAIDSAFRALGFVFLTNHGLPASRVDESFDWSKHFFSLPSATKLLAPHPPGGSHHRGYSAPGREQVTTAPTEPLAAAAHAATTTASSAADGDFKESFDSGNPDDANQPNIWPPADVLPGFREGLEAFFADASGLVGRVLGALGVALGLEDGRLEGTHAARLFQLRMLHYPPVPRRGVGGGRIGAHSDFGTLTLLWQDRVGGLEVKVRRAGEGEKVEGEEAWVHVAPVEGAVLVNVGDLLERWSNGRWLSAVHRVVAPPGEGEGEGEDEVCQERYSLPFFATADDDTVIDALPGCWGPDNPKRYEAVTARDYVQMRMAALY